MSGVRNCVTKQIMNEEPKVLFTPCYEHDLNLASSDTIKRCHKMKKALETTLEITKLVKYFPRREGLFQIVKGYLAPDTPGVLVLCLTRWAIHAESMLSQGQPTRVGQVGHGPPNFQVGKFFIFGSSGFFINCRAQYSRMFKVHEYLAVGACIN